MADLDDQFRREVLLPSPIDRVWAAITDPGEVNQWFGDLCSCERPEGAEGAMQWGEDAFRSRVVTVETPHRCVYRWVTPRDDPAVPFEAMPTTLVEFMLQSVDDGALLVLTESGFAAHPEDQREANYAANRGGWTEELGELRVYLAAKGR